MLLLLIRSLDTLKINFYMKKLLGIVVLGLGLVLGVNANTAEKPNAYFCTYIYKQKPPLNHPPAQMTKFGTLEQDGCPYETLAHSSKKISMREYINIMLNWYLKNPTFSFNNENGYISFLKSFKRKFTKHNLDTAYLDSQIIYHYSDKLDKNKILTALKIEKEPTEKQLLASLNMSKEEYEQTVTSRLR